MPHTSTMTLTVEPDPDSIRAFAETVTGLREQLCDLVAEARDLIADVTALTGRPLVSGLYSIAQAAERLGLGTTTAYAMIAAGTWPAEIEVLDLGASRKVRVSEVEAYLAPRAGS